MNIKQTIFILLAFILPQYSFGQKYFNRLYDGPFLYSSLIEVDSGFIVTGDIFAPVNKQISITRMSASGDTIWNNIFGSFPKVHGSNQIIRKDNEFIITGTVKDTAQAPDVDIVLISFNLNGDSLWYHRYGGTNQEVPSTIISTSDNGFAISGTTDSYGAGNGDFYLIKTDSLGNLEWQKTYGGAGSDINFSVIETTDLGYILSGGSTSFNSNYDVYTVKTDSLGNIEWQKTFDSGFDDDAGVISDLHDNSFILSSGYPSGDPNKKGKLLKIDPLGSLIWQMDYSYTSGKMTLITHPIESYDGTIITGGVQGINSGTYKGLILKTDPLGNLIWQREYFTRPDLPQYIYDIKQTGDSGFVFCGSAFPDTINQQHAWIVKTDCFGCDSNLCYYADSSCYIYDCTLYPIDAFFTVTSDTLDLAYSNSVFFTNSSFNTSARIWNFGDGEFGYTTDTISHTFTQSGTYLVSLIVYHGKCMDTFARQIEVINTVGTNENTGLKNSIYVYPNPSNGIFSVETEFSFNHAGALLEIADITGKKIKCMKIHPDDTKITLTNSTLESGLYYCNLIIGGKIVASKKIIILK